MDKHRNTTTRLQLLLDDFYAADEYVRPVVKHELLGCYCQLTAQERLTMQSVVLPFIDEIEREMMEKDPLAQQARELLSRLAGPVHVVK